RGGATRPAGRRSCSPAAPPMSTAGHCLTSQQPAESSILQRREQRIQLRQLFLLYSSYLCHFGSTLTESLLNIQRRYRNFELPDLLKVQSRLRLTILGASDLPLPPRSYTQEIR